MTPEELESTERVKDLAGEARSLPREWRVRLVLSLAVGILADEQGTSFAVHVPADDGGDAVTLCVGICRDAEELLPAVDRMRRRAMTTEGGRSLRVDYGSR